MADERGSEDLRLERARQVVQSFLVKKRRAIKILFVSALAAEAVFFLLMLFFMDFRDRLHLFLLFGFLLVYTPLILFSWHNAEKIDHLYYRLVDELKYGGRGDGA